MLDTEQQADYEAWKERKLMGSIDLSVGAYNAEMESQAVAWEEGMRTGVRRLVSGLPPSRYEEELISQNPYRKAGMNGERPHAEPLPEHQPSTVSETSETQLPAGAGPGETDPVEDARRAFGIE